MSKIVIIGGSLAGHSLAVKLREISQGHSITLLTEEHYPFYDRRKFIDFLGGRIKEKELFLATEEYYQKNNINFLKDSKATSITPQRKTVYFKNGDKSSNLNYDFLVICSGRRFALSQIDGAKKTGVFTLYSLAELKEFFSFLMGDTFGIAGINDFSLKVAQELTARKKEVKLISDLPSEGFVAPEGVEFINSQIIEVIGESETQAIKLKEGKIIGVTAVVFLNEQKSNIEFLKGAGIEIANDFISVNQDSESNLADIYACGAVARRKDAPEEVKAWDNIIEETAVLAQILSNR